MSAQIGSLNQNIAKAKIGQKKMCPPCIFVLSSKRACFRDCFRRKSFCPLHMFYQSPSTASSLKSKTYITPGLCRSKLIINCWNQYLLLVDQSFSLSHACVYIDTGVLRHLGWYAWNRTHTHIYMYALVYIRICHVEPKLFIWLVISTPGKILVRLDHHSNYWGK